MTVLNDFDQALRTFQVAYRRRTQRIQRLEHIAEAREAQARDAWTESETERAALAAFLTRLRAQGLPTPDDARRVSAAGSRSTAGGGTPSPRAPSPKQLRQWARMRRTLKPDGLPCQVLRAIAYLEHATNSFIVNRAIRARLRQQGVNLAEFGEGAISKALYLLRQRGLVRAAPSGEMPTPAREYHLTDQGRARLPRSRRRRPRTS